MRSGHRKALYSLLAISALLLVGVGSLYVGYLQGRASAVRRLAPDVARMLVLTRSELRDAALATSQVRQQLADRTKSHGIAEEAEVVSVWSGGFGIPIEVEMNVQRRGKVLREALRFDSYFKATLLIVNQEAQ